MSWRRIGIFSLAGCRSRGRAHVAVLPSRREGLPLPPSEAAACAGDSGNGRSWLPRDCHSRRNRASYAGDDAPTLASAIERLLHQPQLRAQCAAAARRLVVQSFSADIVGRRILAPYRFETRNSPRMPEGRAMMKFGDEP